MGTNGYGWYSLYTCMSSFKNEFGFLHSRHLYPKVVYSHRKLYSTYRERKKCYSIQYCTISSRLSNVHGQN
jgi:hypothetical protein